MHLSRFAHAATSAATVLSRHPIGCFMHLAVSFTKPISTFLEYIHADDSRLYPFSLRAHRLQLFANCFAAQLSGGYD